FDGGAGPQGMGGAAGIPGAEGFDGGAAPQGMGGAAGIPGAEGFDGGAAPQGMGGAAGIPGADGFDGGAFPQGMEGASGIPGAEGFDGGAQPHGAGMGAGIPGAEGFDGGAQPHGAGMGAGIPGADGFEGNAQPHGAGMGAGIPGAQGFGEGGAGVGAAVPGPSRAAGPGIGMGANSQGGGGVTWSDEELALLNEKGSVKYVITVPPVTMKHDEKVIQAINALLQNGTSLIGVEKKGKLDRVITESDLRQLMGPFYGSRAMTSRDKALFALPIDKVNYNQTVISIRTSGTINQAAEIIDQNKLRALPVVSNKQGSLRGFVTVHGLLNIFRKKNSIK
ncbi:MAG: CBS domain-containing protein, partial [Magnetococcales bacterium]|nr:CBS domain-containing protein [Magnetococcales bacterium]